MNVDAGYLSALAATLLLIYILFIMQKRNIDFGIRTILAMFMGLTLGAVFPEKMEYVSPIGTIYVNLITSIVVPLLFVSVFSSISSLKDITKLKSIGGKTIFWLVSNTVIAATIGIVIALIFKVGDGMDLTLTQDYTVMEVPSFLDVIVNLFPKNIISDAGDNKIIAIIIFSILLGVSEIFVSAKDPEITKPFKKIIASFQAIINMMVSFLVQLTPYAVLTLIATAVSKNGISKLLPLIKILTSSYLACIIQIFVVCSLLLFVFAKINPFRFFKKIWTAMILAFTSQSSIGTMPVTIDCLTKNVGVSKSIASFVTPLGSTMGMPGCSGIWPVVLAVSAINALGIEYNFFDYLFLIFLSAVVSFGTVGVPGTATISATAVFTAAGLPIEMIIITTPISAIVDMIRTATNVTSAATVTTLVAKSQNEIDMDVFNS